MGRAPSLLLALVTLVAGCTSGGQSPAPAPSASSPAAVSASPTATPAPSRTASTTPTPSAVPARLNVDHIIGDIDHLAGEIGPREATSANFRRAASFVEQRLERLGYRVRRVNVPVPAGNSWGVPVRAGRTVNLTAEPPGFDSRKPHVVVGAHLDTVPQAPGAEDNASGIAVLLELARMVRQQPAEFPVKFIAFGAEEPRGAGDALHHFGSRREVASLSATERRAVRAMVSLDRVGVSASYVPVCTATGSGTALQRAVRRAGSAERITTRSCVNRASDHWSYARAGLSAVRIGGVAYVGYHSPGDVASVISRRQLDRVGRLVWAWLQSLG
jgi:hypothetical protein